ncbi:MAG TPA: LEPR-XLL domain-containing protein [Phycisphaerales bacterium]|nr:LEPR-XLL domain-containing protein [Phycisphaerales bacterium]
MTRQDLVSRITRKFGLGSNRAAQLSRNAGRASSPMADAFEALEPRILLSGDHPGIDEVFADPPTAVPTEIVLVNEIGLGSGIIGDVANDTGDFFRFTADVNGFVSILANTVGGTLDSALELYLPDGTKLSDDTEGFDNGTTARGLATDGWLGFVAQAGQEYYIRVMGESSTTGAYALQINAKVNSLTIDQSTGFVRTGSATGQEQTISGLQEDVLYEFTTPDLARFTGLGTIMAGDIVFGNDSNGFVNTPDDVRDLVDTRVELYDSAGNLIGADSSAGHQTDGFLVTRFERDTQYFVRVRSDAFENTNVTNPQSGLPDNVAIGDFELRIQAAATDFSLDPTTRTGVLARDNVADGVGLLRDQHSAQLFTFDALGSGDTIINFFSYANIGFIIPGADPKIQLFNDSSTTPIEANDTAVNFDGFDRAEIQTQLQGGDTYYVLVDSFDGPFLNVGAPPRDIANSEIFYQFVIESNATLDRSDADQPIDDHVDFLADRSIVRDLATPLIWGDPITPVGFVDDSDYVDTNGDGNPDAFGDGGGFVPVVYPSVFDFPNEAVDHVQVVQAFASGRLDTFNDTDVFMFTPQIDHLGAFEGGRLLDMDGQEVDPPVWDLNGRPASRISLSVNFELEWLALGTTAVQIYDSNFELINEEMMTPIQSVNVPPSQSPAGVESPSLLGPDPETKQKREVAVTLENLYWGGEAYYIVISAPGTRTRYNLVLQGDSEDRGLNGDTPFATTLEAPEEGNFGDAEELFFDINTGLATTSGNPSFTAERRTFTDVKVGVDDPLDANFFDTIIQSGELGNISRLDDTDLYKFVAPNDGTAEIVISTTQIQDVFNEIFFDSGDGSIVAGGASLSKTYNSPLDAAIRVFDSAGNQLAYVDNFLGTPADGLTIPFGSGGNPNVGDLQIFRKDPRAVINVQEGQEYFVLVESSQRWRNNAEAPDPADRIATNPAAGNVDWRVATGSYQLVVNATPNLDASDDHADTIFRNFQQTVIPINSDPNSPDNGTGSVSGAIEVVNDSDTFEFVAPVDGLLTITLDPSASLSLVMNVLDGANNNIFLPNNSAFNGEPLTVSFAVNQAERYEIALFGLTGTGTYTMDLSGLPVGDDLPDGSQFFAATELVFPEFSRSAETSATLDQGGDSDVFYFDATVTDLATLTVSRGDGQAAMTPAVEIYELGQDNAATPNPLNNLIAWDRNPNNDGTVVIDFSTQIGRRYFVVVKGSDPNSSLGGYDLKVDYDPADDHADLGDLLNATFVNIVPSTGAGSETGILEQVNDSDLFVFGVPANGPVDISLVWTPQTGAEFELRIFDIDGNPFDVNNNGVIDTFKSSSGFLAIDQFTGAPADIFYVAVLGPTATRIDYTLNVNTGLVDDHANDGAFGTATAIPLDLQTGDGSATGRLEVDDDTDFFTFDVLDDGIVTVSLDTPTIETPVFKLYDSSFNLLSPTQVNANTIQFTNSSGVNATYFVSIGSTFPGIRTGSYTISVDGPPVAPAPGDDHANIGDLVNATVLDVNPISGDASDTGIIDNVIDNDLFKYVAIGRGEVFVQVFSEDDPTPDFTVRVFSSDGTEIVELANATGVDGVAGVTAATAFDAASANQTFYLLVDSTNDIDTGNYTIRVDGAAATTRTYYPEGFANAGISEFISLANPNDEAVSYNITVYYADTNLGSAVVASGTLAAGARGGATLSFGGDIDGDGNADYAPGIIPNEAYSIVVESSLRLGAGLSHYDANLVRSGAIGEVFTDQTTNRWEFPDVTRNPGVVEEFLVYFNPNSFDVNVTITAFTGSGQTIQLPVQTLAANQRGGIEVHSTTSLPLGTFAVEITSAPVDSADADRDLGIVAALSRYNLLDKFAFGYLGIRDGGSTTNIVTSLTNGTDVTSEFSIFNPGSVDAQVTIKGSYLEEQNLPDLFRTVTVGAGESLTLTGSDLAFVNNAPIGLEITSNVDVAISTLERQRGDADATGAFTEAGTSFFFGDAFLNPSHAGDLYSESLSFYNPNSEDTDVTITFYFADGSAERVRMETVAANDFLLLKLENLAEVVQNRPNLNYYSMRIDATSAIVTQLTHYDGFLGGGWATGGAPLGLLNPIV